jgi:membrane-associated phospholipid phosphatase
VKYILVFALCCSARAEAQTKPVVGWADDLSYATAAINPTIAAVEAWRSPSRLCHFGRLAISEAVANGVGITIKHFVVSPRPCLGCAPDGMPSGHTWNSAVGYLSSGWGFTATIATGVLRHEANRHTWPQVIAGAMLGVGAEASGLLLKCKGDQ